MAAANFISARDLFLAHHWRRYVPFDRVAFDGFTCGRIVARAGKDGSSITIRSTAAGVATDIVLDATSWSPISLREPKAAESAPPVREVLAIGDWVGVDSRGVAVLFAPCAHHGTTAIQDGELFQTRMKSWAQFTEVVRKFFAARGFAEVTTPTLATSPGTEPFLDPLLVQTEFERMRHDRYLITSPEFNLKKALGAGVPRVFEIAKCFRNKEGGAHHRIEFHMLEWYRSFASLEEIANDTEELIRAFVPESRLKRVSMRELFGGLVGVDLRPDLTREQIAEWANAIGVRITSDDDFDDIFHRIFLEKIEPNLEQVAAGGPVLIYGYPPSMAALARIGPDGFADRFEIYWRGLEICNAFHELNDPSENRKRFEKDNHIKQQSGRVPVPIDGELMRTFDLGVPPAGGIALGLERLFMAVYAIANIENVRPYLEVHLDAGLDGRRE